MVLKRIIFFVIIGLSFSTIQAQDFKVTDIKFNIEDKEEIQRVKQEMLGTEFRFIFYDSSVKVGLKVDENKYDEVVLDKTSNGSNIYDSDDGKLTLKTTFNYINSAELEIKKGKYTLILKRK
jgi:hypothetical protein